MNAPERRPDLHREPAVRGQPVVDPAEWRGTDLAATRRWMFELGDRDLGILMSVARTVRKTIGDDPNGLLKLPASAFDFGPYAETIASIRHELKDGLGAALIRRLPMEEMDPLDAATIFWGIGRHLGQAISNNPEGDMLGHVTDLGKTQKDPLSRGYQTREEMNFHCDQSTLVGLLCVRTPKSGGLSKISSSVAMYNELRRRSPESVELLSQPFCWTKHGEMNPGELGYYESPVFNFLDRMLCTSFGPTHIQKGHQLPEAPPLTEAQLAALTLAKTISDEQHYAMTLERGDIQFLNNSVAVHTRTAYEDWPEAERKRLLWRLWLVAPDIRPSTPYITQWGVGVKLNTTKERIVL
jgi:hypothetical protein